MNINECTSVDIYADDADTNFADEFKESVDIYEDVISIPTLAGEEPTSPAHSIKVKIEENSTENRNDHEETPTPEINGRRHQLYIGNLTWWTKDDDVFEAITSIGVKDCAEVLQYDQTRGPSPKMFGMRSDVRFGPGVMSGTSPTHGSQDDSGYGHMMMPDWMESNGEEFSYADAIYEKILHNNRKISSTAIARAVSETASGDFRGAIDTLQTALSLIRQSQTADDDRCKILISSLQDTLYSVENKAYEARPSARSRDRLHEANLSPDRRSRSRYGRDKYVEGDRRDFARDDYEDRSRKRRLATEDIEDRDSRASPGFGQSKRSSFQEYSRKDDRDAGDRRTPYDRDRERSVRRSRQ